MRPEAERALLVDGFMQPNELAWLADRAAECDTVIEVGSWKGRSTTALCAARERVDCVDNWSGRWGTGADYEAGVWEFFAHNLREERASGKVRVFMGDSTRLARWLSPVDMVFIDADHTYFAVKSDIEAYRPLVKPGGLLCGHDYHPTDWPDVVRAVDEAFPNVERAGFSIWWVRL